MTDLTQQNPAPKALVIAQVSGSFFLLTNYGIDPVLAFLLAVIAALVLR